MTNLINGDAQRIALADESVQCIITSPPYWGLRSYLGADDANKPLELGAERVPDCLGWATGHACGSCYVCHIVSVMRECWRVLRIDGVCWLNLGDSFASGEIGRHDSVQGREIDGKRVTSKSTMRQHAKLNTGLKPKDLCMIPARVALALQASGAASPSTMFAVERIKAALLADFDTWDAIPDKTRSTIEALDREWVDAHRGAWWVRSEIIWHKPNPMPESVTDRPTKAHEMIYLLTKRAEYYYDAEAIKEVSSTPLNSTARQSFGGPKLDDSIKSHAADHGKAYRDERDCARNRRSVWTVATSPYSGAHFATFPPALVEPMILAGTSQRGACPTCGKAWRRVVDRNRLTRPELPQGDPRYRPNTYNGAYEDINGKGDAGYTETNTLGFAPACACYVGIPAAPTLPEMPDDAIAPKPCDQCDGTGHIDPLPMFGDALSNICPICGGTGGTPANKIWIKWRKQWEKINAERIAVYELIKDMDLPVVPCKVLDPFVGSGTVLRVAIKHGRIGIGNDLNINYAPLTVDRTSKIQRVMTL